MVGKLRLELTPRVNHWWNTTLYVSARGLTTAAMPYRGELLEAEFDVLDNRLELRSSFQPPRTLQLEAQPVATFYRSFMALLRELGVEVELNPKPQEMPDTVPFDQDTAPRTYDGEYARRFWRVLASVQPVLEQFRARFIGKASPVQFFWGSFDLAATRFSGRPAPPRPGVITSEAYSQECSSVGWWPGGGRFADAAFFAYTAPAPAGLAEQRMRPEAAYFHPGLGEFLLPYAAVRQAASPEDEILAFAQSAYGAGATLAGWDRKALERA